MKLKDFKFKCTKLGNYDPSFSHCMELYDLYGNYLYSLKYLSGEDDDYQYSKKNTRLELIKYIKENEQKIYDYILSRRRKELGLDR